MSKVERPIGVAVIVLQNSKILMGRRRGGYKPGTMGIPGGRIEQGESIENTVVRELQEEAGIVPQRFEFVGVVRNDQRESAFVHFVYVCTEFLGKPSNMEPDKCDGWDWYSLDSLPQDILPGHRAAIEMFNTGESLRDMY